MAQQQCIKDVMKSMGLTDGAYLPVVNDENKQLMELVDRLLKDKTEKSTVLQVSEERLEKLRGHHKNAEQDIGQNLKLINAHRSQLEAETHMLKLAERENSKVCQLLKDVQKDFAQWKQYEETAEKEIKKLAKKIETISEKIEWAKISLVEWREAMTKGEEINRMIEKFCKADESQAFTLESRRRMLQDTINKQRKILVESYQEQHTLEQSLNRSASLYRQAHYERREMVDTWKHAVNQMSQRERDIGLAEVELEHKKSLCASKRDELKQHDSFLQQLVANNKEQQLQIDELNDEVSHMRSSLDDVTSMVVLRESEVTTARKILQSLAQRLQQQRQRNRQILSEMETKEAQLNDSERVYNELQDRYEKFMNSSMSAQERLQQLDELINDEAKRKGAQNKEIVRLNGLNYRLQQQLNAMKSEEKTLQIQNEGLDVAIHNMKNSIKKYEIQLQQQIEADYNLGFKIQMLQIRISKIEGKEEAVDSDKLDQLADLEKQMEKDAKDLLMLQLEINRLQDNIKQLTSSYDISTAEIKKTESDIKEAILYCEGGEKQLKATIQQNQELIVELSVRKMRIHEMEKQIAKHSDKVYNLQRHRLELEKVIKERLIDIKSELNLLLMKKKHILEERGTLRADFGERKIKINALKKRYELAVELLGKNEDGTFITTTQLKIEVAQEKQILLDKGNELNEKVIRAEQDIKAMENTLCLINFSNDSYRKSFEQVDEENSDYVELKTQQENYCGALQKLKVIKNSINSKLQDIEGGNERREELEKEMEDKIRIRMDHKEILMKVYKELVDQKTKLQRAERELKLACKAVHQKGICQDYLSIFEKDLNFREIEEKNTTSLQLMADLVDINPDLAADLSRLLYEKGLQIPQIRRSRSQASMRSDYSVMSGETGMRLFTRLDKDTISSSSSRLSSPTMGSSSVQYKMPGSACPSIVSIDFPDNKKIPSSRSTSARGTSTKETSSTSKHQKGKK